MFELHTSSDLLISLSQYIYSYRQGIGIDDLVITPRILNQEKGGTVIFAWNDVIKDKPDLLVTIFGLYEPETQKYSVIYTYDKQVKVVSCSVNQEKTLLAFSVAKPVDPSVDKKQKVVFQGYLAELQSAEKNVYSLNMERSTFLKVQFLYPEQQPKQSHSKESDMLVFLHKESIGLYKIPTARIGERGIMMSGQPKTEQVVRKFVWCQWDVQHQRLHYIHNVRLANGSSISHSMSTLQFNNSGKAEIMINMPINFPFPYIRTADKPHYGDIPFHPGIPELSLNIAVLTQSSGTFCLCYHKLLPDHMSPPGTQSASDCQNVEYYISMVHHAKTLYGCVSSLPKHVICQKRLVFSWVGSYLLVMLPGYFVHLLNVGPSFEPCHHILLHDYTFGSETFPNPRPISVKFSVEDDMSSDHSPSMTHFSTSLSSSARDRHSSGTGSQRSIPVFSDYCCSMKTLLPCQGFVRESGSIAQNLYDYRSGCMMKLVLNTDLILDSFQNTYWQTRLAILHYMILHNKDVYIVKKLFEILSENLTMSEITSMFTEFLVASTYAEMKKQVDREVLNLLAFTASQTLRGQYEKNAAGDRLAHVSYMPLEIVDYNKKLIKDSKSRSKEDYWETLIRRLRLRHSEVPPRFSHVTVMRTYRQAEMEEAGGKMLWDPMHVEDSFFDGIYTLKITEITPSIRRSLLSDPVSLETPSISGRYSRMDTVLGQAPLFLQTNISPESNIFKRRLSMLTEDLLLKHLLKYLPKESHSKARNVAKEYLYCQAKVARQLCHLIWSLRGSELSAQLEDALLPNLQLPGTNDEYELFQLFERFYLTVSDLGYPLPIGFSSFLTALGFKCLDLHLFFQYVDNHILVLTPDFILQILKDLPDDTDEEIPLIKYQIISRLPQPFADECFERWDHPIAKERKARNQVSQILLKAPNSMKENLSTQTLANSRITTTFPPLTTFLRHLELMASNTQSSRPITFDPVLVESVALHHTQAKTKVDLSLVNF